jgi:hypothetical protein
MRIVVFPFCLLANVYANKPTPHDEWYIISFEYGYLLTMAFVLYGMPKGQIRQLNCADSLIERARPSFHQNNLKRREESD